MRGYTLLRNVLKVLPRYFPPQAGIRMAIYRFEAKVISRGSGGRSAAASAAYRTGKFANGGKSAVSAAAYRAGAQLTDERTGQSYDYTNKRGVLGAEIMVPAGAAPFFRDRQQLWAAVERIEKRKDAQLARDFILTLPHELSQAQRVALTREFVAAEFCAKGLVADIAWHAPGKRGDERNYHAHVMVPMRRLDGDGFAAKKDRPTGGLHPAQAWKDELGRLREAWAEMANEHLAAAGLDIRLDHRSLAERGIDREPEPKIGSMAHNRIEAEGRMSRAGNDNRDVKARNAERAALKTELAAAAAEEARIVDLVTHRLRGDEMEPDAPNEELLRQQAQRQAEEMAELQRQEETREQQLAQAREQAELQQQAAREAFKRQAEEQAEASKKQADLLAQDEAKRQQEGEIVNASARYSLALGNHYDVRDPYGSLAKAAMAEYAALVKGQEELRQQIAKEPDADKRRAIELRKYIEAHDYMAITSERLAGISATIAGRENAPQAILDQARAEYYAEQSAKLRQERSTLMLALDEKQKQQQERPQEQARDGAQSAQPGTGRPAPDDRMGGSRKSGPLAPAGRGGDEVAAKQRRQPAQSDKTAESKTAESSQPGKASGRRDEQAAEDALRTRITGRTEGDAELSDAQQAALDKLASTRATIAERDAAKKKERDRGGGGRGGR